MDVNVRLTPTGRFSPSLTQGDREFYGHGPQVNSTAVLYSIGTKLFVHYHVAFQETDGKGSDHTRFEGAETHEVYDIARDYPGKKLVRIKSATDAQFRYTFAEGGVKNHLPVGGGLIEQASLQGDQQGIDNPWIQFDFSPAVLQLSD